MLGLPLGVRVRRVIHQLTGFDMAPHTKAVPVGVVRLDPARSKLLGDRTLSGTRDAC